MGCVVAVVDPRPVYRDGLAVVLGRAGHRVEAGDDPTAWAGNGRPHALLITVTTPADVERLRTLRAAAPEVVAVALLVEPTPEASAEVLQAGATGRWLMPHRRRASWRR